MKKHLINMMILSTIAITNISHAEKPKNDINIVVRPAIYGLWGMQIPNNQCVEYYNFKDRAEITIKSAEEWSTGEYEYQPSNEDKKVGALALQIKYDNHKKDCSGKQVSQAGDLAQYFVQWKDNNNIEFCDAAKGGQCFVKLNRVLP